MAALGEKGPGLYVGPFAPGRGGGAQAFRSFFWRRGGYSLFLGGWGFGVEFGVVRAATLFGRGCVWWCVWCGSW